MAAHTELHQNTLLYVSSWEGEGNISPCLLLLEYDAQTTLLPIVSVLSSLFPGRINLGFDNQADKQMQQLGSHRGSSLLSLCDSEDVWNVLVILGVEFSLSSCKNATGCSI